MAPDRAAILAYLNVETAGDAVWLAIGVFAQLMFTMRFIVQWIASERAGRSIVPVAFWYFSLAGGVILFAYGLERGEPVILLGQTFGIVIYLRNIWLIHAEHAAERARHAASLPPQPLRAAAASAGDARWALIAGAAIVAVTLYRLVTLWATGLPLHGDEAQYWTWAQDLDWGYYSKPPLVAWAIAAAEAVCGPGEACLRAPAALCYAIGAAFVFLLGRRLFGARIGAWAAVVYATLPGVGFSALLITTDPLLLAFWAAGLYALHRAAVERSLLWWGLCGACVGFGLLAKYAMIAFPASLALWVALDPAARRAVRPDGVALAALVAGALFAPNLIWNAMMDWPTFSHTRDNAALEGALFNAENLATFFGEQFGVFGPLLMVALVVILVVRPRTVWRDGRMRLLILFAAPILAFMLAQSFLSRAHANWAAPAYVAGALLVAGALMTRRPRLGRAVLAASVALHLAVTVAAYEWDRWAPAAGLADAKFDPFQKRRGWDELGAAVGAELAARPGARLLVDHRMTLASLIREVEPHPFDARKWNPGRAIRDHYDLTADLGDERGGAFVFVTRGDEARVAGYFEDVRLIRPFTFSSGGGKTLTYRIYAVEGFRGYGGGLERVKGIEPSS